MFGWMQKKLCVFDETVPVGNFFEAAAMRKKEKMSAVFEKNRLTFEGF